MAESFVIEDRILAVRLGAGDLEPWRPLDSREWVHHGYQNGCCCEGCLEREKRVRVLAENPLKRFPWEEAA